MDGVGGKGKKWPKHCMHIWIKGKKEARLSSYCEKEGRKFGDFRAETETDVVEDYEQLYKENKLDENY
jgi:hypothetical protein